MDNETKENSVEETEAVQTVLKDNVLDALPVWTTVYVPYISLADSVYEIRECVIESIWDLVENNVITIFYNCKVSNTDNVDGEHMTLNILANVSTSYEEAEKDLNEFLEKQIIALDEHSKTIEDQLTKNNEHIKMFKEKLN